MTLGTDGECENKCENRLISVLMPHKVKVRIFGGFAGM
jgi:hypothetical protein